MKDFIQLFNILNENNFVIENPVENPNSTNDIYSGDIFGYWEGIDAQFINRINTRNVIYADGHHSIITSNYHNISSSNSSNNTNSVIDMMVFLNSMVTSNNLKNCMIQLSNQASCENLHGQLLLPTTIKNQAGFNTRKTSGESAGQKIITKINNGEIVFNKQTDTLDIVCHSMGYAYAVGIINKLKTNGVAHFGRIYIIAPENASSGSANWADFDEVWQYGSNLGEPNEDPLYLQDGIAPQIEVKDINILDPGKGGRAFIPNGVPKGFKESHSISNYGWIFTERKKEMEGYVKPRK